jgi:hypothetical protein
LQLSILATEPFGQDPNLLPQTETRQGVAERAGARAETRARAKRAHERTDHAIAYSTLCTTSHAEYARENRKDKEARKIKRMEGGQGTPESAEETLKTPSTFPFFSPLSF